MKKILKYIGFLVAVILLFILLGIGYLTFTEYKPGNIEKIAGNNSSFEKYNLETEYKVLNWNIGFAGMDKDVDFFMDGGTRVLPIDKEHVENNLKAIHNIIKKENPDIMFLQEVDENSKRTYGINERELLNDNFQGNNAFAYNFKVEYVPYPFPETIGKVASGIYTNSKYNMQENYRYQLPVPFKYPSRVANLKRAFLVTYSEIAGTDKKVVFVNAHLEAYDNDNAGKTAQTEVLLNFIKEEYAKGNYVIVGADFNQALNDITECELETIPENLWHPQKFIKEQLSDNFKLYYDDGTPTARLLNKEYIKGSKDTYTFVIDGFIVSDNIKVLDVETKDLNFQNSDHNPITLKFELSKD